MIKVRRQLLKPIISPLGLKGKINFLKFRRICSFTETNPLSTKTESAFMKHVKTANEELETAKGNIPERILKKVGENLHENPASPVGIVREKIDSFFQNNFPFVGFLIF